MFPGRRQFEGADNTGNPTLHKPFIDHTNQQFRFPPPNLHSPFLYHILHTCNFSLRELSVSLHLSLSLSLLLARSSFQLYLNTESWKWIKYNPASLRLVSLTFVEMQDIELCSIFINILQNITTKFYGKTKPKMKDESVLAYVTASGDGSLHDSHWKTNIGYWIQ